VVPIKSKHPKEAIDFALFLTNSQNQLEFCKLAPILPSTLDAINSDFFREKPNADLMDKARAISAKQLNRAMAPVPPLANQKDLFQIVDYMTQQVLLGHKKPKAAIDQAVNEWNKILSEN
ncbi:MAG TPA: sugar ABC transporter substrate-binding protein, partial [Cyanobacteria bacterium UBA9579]|nr:sugar ABC transporter substrate-binding protein [Cyanobacteria bacterium UBA9579]